MIGTKGQSKELLKHFKTKKSITSMEAFEKYGVTRLSSHIHQFRKAGYIIDNVWLESENRYGQPCRFVKYVYKGKA